jgi:hypothetical protein
MDAASFLFSSQYTHQQTCHVTHLPIVCFNPEAKTEHGNTSRHIFREKESPGHSQVVTKFPSTDSDLQV